MRHFISSCPVTPGARGMADAPAPAALVALAGCTHRGTPGRRRTRLSAVNLAAVAAATDENLRTATRAQKESARRLHRLSGSTGEIQAGAHSCENPCAFVPGTVWGTTSVGTWRFGPVSCLFLFGARLLPHCAVARYYPHISCACPHAKRLCAPSQHPSQKPGKHAEHEFPTAPLASGLRGAGGGAMENSAPTPSNAPRCLLRHLCAAFESHPQAKGDGGAWGEFRQQWSG
jgi:hypothetical protein